MVFPIIPIGAGLLGTGAGLGIASLLGLGESKKDVGAIETHAAYEHYAPVTTDARAYSQVYAPSQQIQIESPGAKMTKKDTATARSRSDPTTIPISYMPDAGVSAGITEGTDLTKIAIIGVIGLIAYGVVSK